MRINEFFFSPQGEGIYSGMPMQFIRLYGCNLDCPWCDQPNALETRSTRQHYSEFSPDEVAQIAAHHPVQVPICFTGGEPLQQWSELIEVIQIIREKDDQSEGFSENHRLLTMESNSTFFYQKLVDQGLFLSSSPKFQGVMLDDKVEAYGEKSILGWVHSGCRMQFKFVVEDELWFGRIVSWLDRTIPRTLRQNIPVLFQPEWFKGQKAFGEIMKKYITVEEWPRLVDLGFKEIRFQTQMHKYLKVR